MTVRNLDAVFKPSSIALIGASRRERSVGAVVARNLFRGGFAGPVMPVHPSERAIQGVLAYASPEALPLVPDLAVVATPPQTVPGIVEQLGAFGTRGVIVISAGFAELGEEGEALQRQVLEAAKPHLLRVVGPNCLGVMVPGRGINAGFAHCAPKAGDLAFVTQSGAVLTAVLDWARARGIGFSHMVSLGGMADVDFGDMLDYLAADPDTRAILLYIEAVTHARKFMSAARAAARIKPVIVVKAGRSAEAAKAASSHTGALAGADAVYDAAFRRAGMLRVNGLDELFDAVETLGTGLRVGGDRLAILSNGGGLGVLATDRLIEAGGRLAELAPGTLERLNGVLPAAWSHGNPVDIIGDADGTRYADALAALLDDPDHDAILILNCPTAVADSGEAARAVIETLERRPARRKAVLTSWLGEGAAAEARALFAQERVASYATPDHAVRAFMHLVDYRRNQRMLMETPPSTAETWTPDTARVGAVIARASAEGRAWLSEPEAKAVLDSYAIPVVRTEVAATAEEAAMVAERLGGKIALKILSPDITHKSDMGGVALDLDGPEAVREAAGAMSRRIAEAAPEARLEGFSVQEMARMPGAFELILGVSDDVLFGPVILFGQGGTAVEVVRDQALALPPLNLLLAREMIARTRVSRLLRGYRAHPPADLDAIAWTLVKIAHLVADVDHIAELDINPLLAGEHGVLALDARIRIARPERPGTARLAIRPYPKQLEQHIELRDGRPFLLRPIRPEDASAVRAMLERTASDDLRLRFFAPIRQFPDTMIARLTQIDYQREMALVAVAMDEPDSIGGVVRIAADPDNARAEYAVLVRSDLKGRGLGYALMRAIIAYARERGIGAIQGQVLRENRAMLEMCAELGFERHASPDDVETVEVELTLQAKG